MKWMPRQFTLPVLLGVSLTGVGIALIYVLYKQDEEAASSRRNHIESSKRISIEYKVPRKFVPLVIGRGGCMIKDVQRKTGTYIHFKEDNIDCPDRICIIRGTYESTNFAQEMIKSIIANQPVIETYEMFIPNKTCRRIIGRGGEVINQIQATSSAKLIIESNNASYNSNGDRRVIIKGTAEQIAAALLQIEEKVQEEAQARTKLEASTAARLPRGKLSPRNTAVNATEQSQSTELPALQVTDGTMEIYVSAMESPNQFWVQVVGSGTTALDNLVSDMTAYYNENESREIHALKNVTLGQIVAAKFSFDEQWYRAEVISAPEGEQCEVYFVDYGDHEVVQLDSVLELRTDFLSLRLQAIECSLANIKPRDGEWSTEACDRFAELISLAQWKLLVAKVKGYKERAIGYGRSRREGTPIPCVDIFDKNDKHKDINVGQQLINEGFAEPEETLSSAASSTLSLSTRSHDATSTSRPASVSPLAKRVLSPETSTQNLSVTEFDSSGLDLTTISETSRTSITDPNQSHDIEEIDLVSPAKPAGRIEEIDLTTPRKDETSRFIENEKKVVYREEGGGDSLRNGNSSNQYNRSHNPNLQINKSSRVLPAGYESDISSDCDDLELG